MEEYIFKGYQHDFKIFNEIESCILFLKKIKKLSDFEKCLECNTLTMSIQKRTCSSEGMVYKCARCNKQKCIASVINPLLPKIPFPKILHAAYLYSRNILDYDVCAMVEIAEKTYIKLKKAFVNSVKVFTPQQGKLGGEGMSVQIDETACSKRGLFYSSENEEPFVRDTQWVLGILCESTGKVILKVLEDRTYSTIRRIISENVQEKTTIKTDGYPSYPRAIRELNCFHEVVNHTEGFVNENGVHTNGIESVWSSLKKELIKRGGVEYDKLPEFIEEYRLKLKNLDRKNNVVFNRHFELTIKNL